jgi:AraC-like DNA-binding protein
LTQAEARVALAITRGESLDEIARARGVTVATVRTQLKSVFSKTRTHFRPTSRPFVGRIKNRDARYKIQSLDAHFLDGLRALSQNLKNRDLLPPFVG